MLIAIAALIVFIGRIYLKKHENCGIIDEQEIRLTGLGGVGYGKRIISLLF